MSDPSAREIHRQRLTDNLTALELERARLEALDKRSAAEANALAAVCREIRQTADTLAALHQPTVADEETDLDRARARRNQRITGTDTQGGGGRRGQSRRRGGDT